MPELESLVREYGYLFVFIGSLVEGETAVVLSGLAAHRGYLNLFGVIGVATVGATLGTQVWFHLGRSRGHALLEKRPQWRQGVERFEALLERWDVLIILAFRFLYGIRTVGAVAMGISPVSLVKFTVLNFVGAAIWAALVATGGYFLGKAMEAILGSVAAYEGWAFLGLLIVAIGFGAWHAWRRRRVSGRTGPAT